MQMVLHVHKNLCTVLNENTIENHLLATYPHRPLCFKKKKTTTTAFLICNRVDLNPYSHDIAFDPQSFRALSFKFQVCLMDLCQSDIQVLYGLQIDNGTQQFVNSSCT